MSQSQRLPRTPLHAKPRSSSRTRPRPAAKGKKSASPGDRRASASPRSSAAPGAAPRRGLAVSVGSGFECRLFDEPIGGARAAGHRLRHEASGEPRFEAFERAAHASESQTAARSQMQDRRDFSAEQWETRLEGVPGNMSVSLTHRPSELFVVQNSGIAKSHPDRMQNIRRGSKVVPGLTTSSKSKCAVRVLFVNHAMIRDLRTRMGLHSPLLKGNQPIFALDASPSVGDVVITPLSSPRSGVDQCATDANENAEEEGYEEALSPGFLSRLRTGLEHLFCLGAKASSVDVSDLLQMQDRSSTEEALRAEVSSCSVTQKVRQSFSTATTGSQSSGNAVDSDRAKLHAAQVLGMPVMGVSVFPLSDHDPVETVSPTLALATQRSVRNRTNIGISEDFTDHSHQLHQSNQHYDQQQQLASPKQAISPSNTDALVSRGSLVSVAHDKEKRGVAARCGESPRWDVLNMSPLEKIGLSPPDAESYTVSQQTSSAPLFAIAMAMPFVQQGSLQTIFIDWVRTQRPSFVQRETVIRNIIYAVLQQLALLHRCGAVHGSVKATNVFFAGHVLEALKAFSSHHADSATDAICTLLGSGTSKISALAGVASRRASTFSQVMTSCISTAAPSKTCGFNESQGENNSSTSHRNLANMTEWTKHVILSDGHYARVEAALIAALDGNRSNSGGKQRSTSECNAGSSTVVDPQPPVLPNTLTQSCTSASGVASDSASVSCATQEELLVFTPEELSYVPPPESITPEPVDAASDAAASPLPFRATNNTLSPRIPLSPSYDIWMVGMLAIHLADGGLPTWMKRQHSPLPRLRPGSWSVRFASFVQRCACADPAQRPSAEELLSDKWFHTVLPDDSAPGRALTSVRTLAPSPIQQQPPHVSRMPCRRAFVDLLVEYHEYAEEWATRVARSAAEVDIRRSNPPLQKSLPSARMHDEGPPNFSMTMRRDTGAASPVGDEQFSRTQSSGRSSRSASASSVSEDIEQETLAFTCDDFPTASEEVPPSFLGAFSVALETCLCELAVEDKDSADARLVANEEQRQQHQQELSGQLLQAFWNMHRECRLSADMWCLALMRQMLNDGRTAQFVAPIMSDETQQCRVIPVENTETVVATLGSVGGKQTGTTLPNSAGTGGMRRQSQTSLQKQESQKQIPDVSPTAFHNYMFCKWCVTTSWALQQQQQLHPQLQQDRSTMGRRRR